MKYVVLIYSNQATWRALPAEEANRVIKVHNDLIDELTASGEFLSIYRLADATNARTVALRDGVPVVTDGPFGESKEVLASLWEWSRGRHYYLDNWFERDARRACGDHW